jgi:hypothetical protein
VNRRIVAALVAALLAVSCTPDQADESTSRGAGKDPVESQLRAQKPVDKISDQFEYECPSFMEGCPFVMSSRSDRRETLALLGKLREDKPSWLRYIKAVEISSAFVETSSQPDAERGHKALVQTGIFVNQAGKDVGAAICLGLLEEKSLAAAFIHGVEKSFSGVSQVLLAQCQ